MFGKVCEIKSRKKFTIHEISIFSWKTSDTEPYPEVHDVTFKKFVTLSLENALFVLNFTLYFCVVLKYRKFKEG